MIIIVFCDCSYVVVHLGLQEESYTVAEDGGSVSVCVQLGGTATLGWPVAMKVFTTPNTALGKTCSSCGGLGNT